MEATYVGVADMANTTNELFTSSQLSMSWWKKPRLASHCVKSMTAHCPVIEMQQGWKLAPPWEAAIDVLSEHLTPPWKKVLLVAGALVGVTQPFGTTVPTCSPFWQQPRMATVSLMATLTVRRISKSLRMQGENLAPRRMRSSGLTPIQRLIPR